MSRCWKKVKYKEMDVIDFSGDIESKEMFLENWYI